jgi:capsular polysaccharide biosynthesis protein
VGTCDNLVSASERYYEGGCTGVNYHKDHQAANISSTSNSTNFPSTIEGCVKQGECNLPFLEQIKHWTGTGSQLTVAAVPDAVMDRLLVGATESSAGACRSSNLYPRNATTVATHNAVMSVTVAGEISDFTTSILQSMETKLALNMGVATDDVTVTAEPGSVVLTIKIAYASESQAAAGATAMSAAMPDAAAASSMLTTDAMTITATAVTTATVEPVSDSSSSGLALGAIVGIAVGGSVAVILVIVLVMFFMMKKNRTPVTPKG